MTSNPDKDKIDYFNSIGKTKLPDKYREQIVTIFNTYPDNWYTPEMFHQGLQMSKAYASNICEVLTLARILEKRKVGNRKFFRMRKEERFGAP